MTTASGATVNAVRLSIGLPDEIVQEIYPELVGMRECSVCFVCWFRSLGIKVPNKP